MSGSSASSYSARARLQDRSYHDCSLPTTSNPMQTYTTRYDVYTFALRAAYLHHLLQPRAKRLQHVADPRRPVLQQRHSSSVTDLVKDFSSLRDSKSSRFPHGFMSELDKRITGVLMGKERSPEYSDPLIKRTFAVFLNEFKKPEFRKSVEKDRKVEDLLLIFFSNATKELQKGKAPNDDHWKLLVDRHVALFVRLISATIKANEWNRDRPELATRLSTLEGKLLRHDQDLSSSSTANSATGGTTVEVEVPPSQAVKDMPMVVTVAAIFGKPLPTVHADVDDQKDLWNEQTALHDLKMYQTNLSLNNGRTLRSRDFDTETAYESWKKLETADLTQMLLSLIRSKPELAKTASGTTIPLKASDFAKVVTSPTEPMQAHPGAESSAYTVDQPVDMSPLNLNTDHQRAEANDQTEPYMFIPSDPRSYYRTLVKEALTHDLGQSHPSSQNGLHTNNSPAQIFSRKTSDLLAEIGLRWRVPIASRMVLLLDAAKEKFSEQDLELQTLDELFTMMKEPQPDKKQGANAQLTDRNNWPLADFVLFQQVLKSVDDMILRDLFEQLQHCYESKPPSIAPLMTVLETQIYDDPIFTRTEEDLDRFSANLGEALRDRAMDQYQSLRHKELGQDPEKVEFYHVIQLGKSVVKFCEKIQKRYRRTPVIMGVEPTAILIEVLLPAFGVDARDCLSDILARSQNGQEPIPMQDGFDLYKELAEVRRYHTDALPRITFNCDLERLLAPFVWQWIETTDSSVLTWVEGAVKHDSFTIKTDNPDREPNDEERHSLSAVDIFRSFNQSVDQILQLEWDNDLDYAKFLTALAKSMGIGIQRYCELLEQQFAKEMDRSPPAQEAALVQSRQEKLMQLAKDAITSKDRIEAFQFLPESFVKLNDIEYSMLQLDKIEREMNVDACVNVMKKQEAPKSGSKKRKNEKFVFTIKIIEAEDLKPCDPNGLSDPYVVLGDEFQKRIAKTRIIYGNLNPRWDETVDITATGLLSVTATIWDWDVMGDHDCVGRTTIKLDPSHFSDYMPREYWLDLDTQGRLLVRITMEGEKDDIQFYFGKAFRSLKRAERDMTRKITDKLSAYIHYCLSRRSLKALTRQNNLSISTVSNYFNRARAPPASQTPSSTDVANTLKPLFAYLNDNFAVMKETLTSSAMIAVMTRVWKEVLSTTESLLVPPLSDKPSSQQQLTEIEVETVFKWLSMLFDFFHAVDESTRQANGVPLDVLKSPKYHDLQNLNFFYFEPTDNLIRTSERMAAATADRNNPSSQGSARTSSNISHHGRQSAPAPLGGPHATTLASTPARRNKSVMYSRNLGTMRKAKEEKRREAQAEPSDDMILRILRMRPEATRYLRDRSRQRERLAAAAAADFIVRQSLEQGAARRRQFEKTKAQEQARPGAGVPLRKSVVNSSDL